MLWTRIRNSTNKRSAGLTTTLSNILYRIYFDENTLTTKFGAAIIGQPLPSKNEPPLRALGALPAPSHPDFDAMTHATLTTLHLFSGFCLEKSSLAKAR